MGKCLLCNIPKEILRDFNFDYSYLTENDLNKNIQELLVGTHLNTEKISFKYPFVFMHDLKEEEMNSITNYLKTNHINAIYAESTQYNLQWKLKDLLNELLEEHEMFQTMNQLQTLIQELMPKMNENPEIKPILMEAFIVLQNKNLNQMKQMIQILSKRKESD